MTAYSWWEERILPRLVDASLGDVTARRWRELVCSRVSGRVLEVGFGSGRNLEYYPQVVHEVLAVEPMDLAWQRAQSRVAAFARPVHRVGLDGAVLPVQSGSVDTVVSTWTLCTIASLDDAISEIRRVLRPTGSLLYVEHVASPHPRARRIQSRMQPLWGRVAGGCHVDRDIEGRLVAGGFEVERLCAAPDANRFELVPFVAGQARPRTPDPG